MAHSLWLGKLIEKFYYFLHTSYITLMQGFNSFFHFRVAAVTSFCNGIVFDGLFCWDVDSSVLFPLMAVLLSLFLEVREDFLTHCSLGLLQCLPCELGALPVVIDMASC